ncbi:hypothetical protein V1525DRAFT_174127 [Lipomyces kononenkoae]|uniref:Uncharacterized protein n=1 Tax=Lipomyces kononenkoae TaxID=34357 RepID=A0ACC3SZT6_LIPKO
MLVCLRKIPIMEPFYFPDHAAHLPRPGPLTSMQQYAAPLVLLDPLPTGPSALYSHAAAPTTPAHHHHDDRTVANSIASANIAALSMAAIMPVDTRLLLPGNSMFALGHRRRASVSRSRTGCWTCRLRRKKCSEEKPACAPCQRLNLSCDGYGDRPDFMKSADAMARKRDEIRRCIRAFKTNHGPLSAPADDSDGDVDADTSRSVSGPAFVPRDSQHSQAQSSSSLEASVPASNANFQRQKSPIPHATVLPKFLDIELPTLDLQSPACPLPLLSHYMHEVPANVFMPSVDRASQLLLVVVYFRFVARLLHPALFLGPDDTIDFKILLYDASISDPRVWQSVCAVASVYTSVVLSRLCTATNQSCIEPMNAQFTNTANSLLSTPANPSLPKHELERAMLLGWNLYQLKRLFGGANDAATLHTLLQLTSRFDLLSLWSRESSLLLALAAYTMHADIISAVNCGTRPILSAIYSDMLSSHFRRDAIVRTATTGVPIATPLLLVLSQILDLEQELEGDDSAGAGAGATNFIQRLEAVSRQLSTLVLNLDVPNSPPMQCSELFRLSIRAYLCCFVSRAHATIAQATYITARDSPGVREDVAAFCQLFASEFLALQPSSKQLSHPEILELERCLLWSIMFIGSITPPDLHCLYGRCRYIIQRVFETCVNLSSFGNWGMAWRIVCTCWRSDLWFAGKSFREVLREEYCGNVIM